MKLWDAMSGQELLTLKGHDHVVFSPEGQRLALASSDSQLLKLSSFQRKAAEAAKPRKETGDLSSAIHLKNHS